MSPVRRCARSGHPLMGIREGKEDVSITLTLNPKPELFWDTVKGMLYLVEGGSRSRYSLDSYFSAQGNLT